MTTKTIMFVHGLFVTYHSWEPWVKYFEDKGYKVIAPAYPLRDKTPAELRAAHPDPKLGELTIDQVFATFENAVKGLDEQPIIIGHSFGGLLTQLLLNKGYGAAGVAIDSVPAMGVLTTKWSFFKAGWPLLNPFNPSSRPYLVSFPEFQYSFLNGMNLEDQKQAYEKSVAPESIRLGRAALSSKAKVDFAKPHVPLLFLAGEIDHIIPADLNKTNYEKYKSANATSITDFKEFAGRNHYGLAADGWEELADYVYAWIQKNNI